MWRSTLSKWLQIFVGHFKECNQHAYKLFGVSNTLLLESLCQQRNFPKVFRVLSSKEKVALHLDFKWNVNDFLNGPIAIFDLAASPAHPNTAVTLLTTKKICNIHCSCLATLLPWCPSGQIRNLRNSIFLCDFKLNSNLMLSVSHFLFLEQRRPWGATLFSFFRTLQSERWKQLHMYPVSGLRKSINLWRKSYSMNVQGICSHLYSLSRRLSGYKTLKLFVAAFWRL